MIGKRFEELINIMVKLREKDGCPWDKEQTHESLKPYLLEEAYEVLEALDQNSDDDLKEELGDLLLQVVFHSQIADEEKRFSIKDVLDTINDKLTRRHPHVFGNVNIETAEEQRVHWEKLKKHEGKESVIDGVPKNLPALLKAHRTQQKASTVGFDWDKQDQVWKKVHEEIHELDKAVQSNNQSAISEEFGDLLFALVNLSRFLHVNPEESLRQANEKFNMRFKKVEQTIIKQGKSLKDATLEEMDAVWNRIKNKLPE